eukprot:gnl/Chilomastix_caulleri/6125.p1 GENE.gnl/Chilomastix_caulleri/6125~~gnl/Chilomastix_caulleri/6125.p1  ORF type:complete len:83 (+),score=15.58 gnl/Chilomastix_caulleri/6125:434-682(+)
MTLDKEVFTFASLTGIDVGVKGVFMEYGNDYYTYSLNNDNTTTTLLEYSPGISLDTLLPSPRYPRDLAKAIKGIQWRRILSW